MSTEAKSNNNQADKAETPELAHTTAPSGMDLRPEPEQAVKISKKVGIALVTLAVVLGGVLAYSGIARQKQKAAAALSAQKKVEPARPDDDDAPGLTLSVPPASRRKPGSGGSAESDSPHLQTATSESANERVVVRSSPPSKPRPPAIPIHEATPEERALASAYASEQQAKLAPTGIRSGTAPGSGDRSFASAASSEIPTSLEALARTLGESGTRTPVSTAQPANSARTEYDEQNLQGQKEGFLETARLGNPQEDYLKFTRTYPMSRFEIKAGWEIPAVLEQALNSDLPGELKALVMANVYDTASGLYLLIPQGSRLVGTYNSRVSYGQNGVQVAWGRIIFPDASAIDLNGMSGLDAQGNAGLRD